MIVKIQILTDDGKTVLAEHLGSAFCASGQDFVPGSHIEQGIQKLYGFCYLPVPPPRDPTDVTKFHRLLAEHF